MPWPECSSSWHANSSRPRCAWQPPLILLVVGLVIGFLPQVGAIEIEPNIILEMVLPPLLFSAAVRMPTMDFRREMQAVAMLAIPLVFLSAFAVGFVINWLVPAISLPWGVALGAVLSPTDAVAISIAKRSGVSHRIITVLEGEGLFNDATSLVLLSAAMSAGLAADEHALNPGLLIGKVALALGIAAVIGWVVGEIGVRLRALIKEPSADTVFSFAMPFIASIPAEHLGGSGLVAAVVAGLVVSRRRAATISAMNRRFSQQNWQTMTLVLESGIFLTMGLQAFGIVEETAAFSGGLAFAAFLAVILGALIMVIRAVFIALMFTWLDHRHKRRQRRYEAEAARIERFEKRMHKASEVDADMLQARDLSPERWEDALNTIVAASSGARAATRCADPTWTTSRANRWARARAVSSSGRACAARSPWPLRRRSRRMRRCARSCSRSPCSSLLVRSSSRA